MTLEELLEKETIKELRIMYSHYFDGKNIDGLVDLFTDDAVCEFGPNYGGDWVGKEQIRQNFAQYAEGEGAPFAVLHAVTNPWIRLIDESTANGPPGICTISLLPRATTAHWVCTAYMTMCTRRWMAAG